MSKKIYINGITCVSCEMVIKDELNKIEGIKHVHVCHKKKTAEISYEGDKLPFKKIFGELKRLGYNGSLNPFEKEINKKPSLEQWIYSFLIVIGFYLVYKYLKWIGLLDWINIGTENINYGASFVIGVVASLSSCLVVVGAVVLSFATKYQAYGSFYQRNLKPHLLFHFGRLLVFFILGGVLGLIGSLFSLSTSFMSLFTILIAVVLVWLGLNILGFVPSLTTIGIRMPKKSMRAWSKLKESEHALAPVILGGFTFFLPCGFTQSMQLFAMSSGSFFTGAMTLFLFALGTTPILMGLGVATTRFKNMKTVVLEKAIGIVIILFALYTMSSGLAIVGIDINIFSSKNIGNTISQGNVQVVNMAVTYNGYEPNVFKLKKDVPVKWVIDGKQVTGCTNEIMIPSLNVREPIKQGKNIIEFTPNKTGTVGFSCWMGMVRGKFIVE